MHFQLYKDYFVFIVTPPNKEQQTTKDGQGQKHILLKYLENSSVKGLPKAYKAGSRFQRILWISAICIGTAIACYMLIGLFLAFFSYETTISNVGNDEKSEFPSISFCNTNPLTMSLGLDIRYPDFHDEIRDDVYPIYLSDYMSETGHIDHRRIPKELQKYVDLGSQSTYFQSLTEEQIIQLGNSMRSTLIQDCVWKPWQHETSADQIWQVLVLKT